MISSSESSVTEIGWDESLNCICIKMTGFMQAEYFQKVMMYGLKLFIEKKADKWLHDISERSVLSLESQTWVVDVWRPMLIEAGLKYIAFIVPKNVLGRMSLVKEFKKVGHDVVIDTVYFEEKNVTAYFSNIESAKEWLSSLTDEAIK